MAAQRKRLEPLFKVHLVIGIAHLQLVTRPARALLEILPLLALLGLVEDLRHVGVLCARKASLDVERRQVAVHLVDCLPDHGRLRRDPLIAHDVAFGQLVDKRGHVHREAAVGHHLVGHGRSLLTLASVRAPAHAHRLATHLDHLLDLL